MTGIVPVFIFFEEASIYTLLDVALDLVDLVLWGLVRTPSYHRASNFGFRFEVHLDQVFARHQWQQRSKDVLVYLDE